MKYDENPQRKYFKVGVTLNFFTNDEWFFVFGCNTLIVIYQEIRNFKSIEVSQPISQPRQIVFRFVVIEIFPVSHPRRFYPILRGPTLVLFVHNALPSVHKNRLIQLKI